MSGKTNWAQELSGKKITLLSI